VFLLISNRLLMTSFPTWKLLLFSVGFTFFPADIACSFT